MLDFSASMVMGVLCFTSAATLARADGSFICKMQSDDTEREEIFYVEETPDVPDCDFALGRAGADAMACMNISEVEYPAGQMGPIRLVALEAAPIFFIIDEASQSAVYFSTNWTPDTQKFSNTQVYSGTCEWSN